MPFRRLSSGPSPRENARSARLARLVCLPYRRWPSTIAMRSRQPAIESARPGKVPVDAASHADIAACAGVRTCGYACGVTDARSMQHPCTRPGRYLFLSNVRSFGLTPDVAVELQHAPAESSAFPDRADRPHAPRDRKDTGYAGVLTRCAAGFPASRAF